jgi:hypothetical protein
MDPGKKFWIRLDADPNVFGKVEGTGFLSDLKYKAQKNKLFSLTCAFT